MKKIMENEYGTKIIKWCKENFSLFMFMVVLFITATFSGIFSVNSAIRLSASVRESNDYRAKYELIREEQQNARAIVEDSKDIITRSATTISELRTQIQDLQNNYNMLWSIYHNSNSNTNYNESQGISVER